MPREGSPLAVCRGRKKRSFNEYAREQFLCTEDGSVSVENIGRGSSTRAISKRTCSKHHSFMTAEGLNKPNEYRGCHICGPHNTVGARQKASNWGKIADKKIRHLFRDYDYLITQARVLQGYNGGVDFIIIWTGSTGRRLSLDIEVDGQQHDERPDGRSYAGNQKANDEKKNQLFIAQKRRLVRLHHNDVLRWADKLNEGKKRTERNPKSTFILFSESYGRTEIVTN